MKETITSVMIKEHARIAKLLDDFSKALDIESFNLFKWTLEKHFFVEEKAVFTISSSLSEEGGFEIAGVMKQHAEMRDMLKNIEEGIMNRVKVDVSNFSEILRAHANFENSVLYPRFDDELTEEQKSGILSRVKEILV